jgi:hypothetical protein
MLKTQKSGATVGTAFSDNKQRGNVFIAEDHSRYNDIGGESDLAFFRARPEAYTRTRSPFPNEFGELWSRQAARRRLSSSPSTAIPRRVGCVTGPGTSFLSMGAAHDRHANAHRPPNRTIDSHAFVGPARRSRSRCASAQPRLDLGRVGYSRARKGCRDRLAVTTKQTTRAAAAEIIPH